MSTTSSLVAVLKADATLAGLLATYDSGPAVFGARPVPPDAVRPYIVTDGALDDQDDGEKNGSNREVVQDIEVWVDATGSVVALEAIAERVRALLHRQAWTVDGSPAIVSVISGPTRLDGGTLAAGRGLTLRLVRG